MASLQVWVLFGSMDFQQCVCLDNNKVGYDTSQPKVMQPHFVPSTNAVSCHPHLPTLQTSTLAWQPRWQQKVTWLSALLAPPRLHALTRQLQASQAPLPEAQQAAHALAPPATRTMRPQPAKVSGTVSACCGF